MRTHLAQLCPSLLAAAIATVSGQCAPSQRASTTRGDQKQRAFPEAASLSTAPLALQPAFTDLAEGLELPVQLTYLSLLLALLSGAAFVVVRQVLVRRELDERSKVLGELIRTGEALSEEYYELGIILARKRLFTQAMKNYNKAIKLWDGDESELAQVHNAMGYCLMNMNKDADAIKAYRRAVELQPGYTIAWTNLADVLERKGDWKDALPAYEAAYDLDPNNATAKSGTERLRTRAKRLTTT